MDTLIIGFSKKKNFNLVSETIKFMEGSKFSHVYLRRNSKYGEYVYQASGLAVNFTNINIFLDHNDIVEEFSIEIDEDQKKKLLEFFIANAGAPYGMDQLFTLAKILICDRLYIKTDKTKVINGKKKFICSELAVIILAEILKVDLDIKESADMVTPLRLYKAIKTHLG